MRIERDDRGLDRRAPAVLRPVPRDVPMSERVASACGHASRMFGAVLLLIGGAIVAKATYELVWSDASAARSQAEKAEAFANAQPAVTAPSLAASPVDELVDDGSQTPLPSSPGLPTPADVEPHVVAEPEDRPLFLRGEYGELAGRLRIPAIGVDLYTSFGTGLDVLAGGPGVWEYGSVPGSPGNATVAGHRTSHGAPFRDLDQLVDGDLIYFEVPGRETSVFEVRGAMVVEPDNVAVTHPTGGVRLTLTTCTPPGSTRYRLIVQAELVSGEFADQALPADSWSLVGDPNG